MSEEPGDQDENDDEGAAPGADGPEDVDAEGAEDVDAEGAEDVDAEGAEDVDAEGAEDVVGAEAGEPEAESPAELSPGERIASRESSHESEPRGPRTVTAPLSDLVREVEEAAEADADIFEQMEVGDLDSEALWEAVVEGAVAADEAAGRETGAATTASPAEAAPIGSHEPPEGVQHVVDKREFCHRCRYFTQPPETGCSHEGTAILEVVDADRFRVRNCPMVGEPGRTKFEAVEETDVGSFTGGSGESSSSEEPGSPHRGASGDGNED